MYVGICTYVIDSLVDLVSSLFSSNQNSKLQLILSFNFSFCFYAASLSSITPLVLYFFLRTSAASFGRWKVHFLIIFFNIFMHFPSNFEGTHVPPFTSLLLTLFPVSRFSLCSLSVSFCVSSQFPFLYMHHKQTFLLAQRSFDTPTLQNFLWLDMVSFSDQLFIISFASLISEFLPGMALTFRILYVWNSLSICWKGSCFFTLNFSCQF